MYKLYTTVLKKIKCLIYSGDPLPHIEYTKQEVETWGTVFRELTKLYPTHACNEYNHLFPLFVENCGYREDCIPQFEDISNFLKGKNNNYNYNYRKIHIMTCAIEHFEN